MAFSMAKNASLMVNSQDYSTKAYKEDLETKTEELDNTTHSISFHKTSQAGLLETDFQYSIYYDQDTYLALRTLWSARTTHSVIYGPIGTTSGMPRTTISGYISSMKGGFTVDGIPTIDVTHHYGDTVPVFDTY